ncbi:synaptogyrin-2-like [Oscarella lobularis]|uniref:synaptogyrin-2-like n=1 Tax=Oscarella lobularis TaxID=121494 RepID=UPI00331430B8
MNSNRQRFDPVAYIKTPQVILRIVSLVFAIVVFACIADGVANFSPRSHCLYAQDRNACNYGTVIGALAFVACLAFLAIDALLPGYGYGSSFKKNALVADAVFSTLWTLMWFVGFCLLAERWRNTVIGALSVFGFRRLRAFDAGGGRGYYTEPFDGDPDYSSFPDFSESYQKSPFTSERETSDAQPPPY